MKLINLPNILTLCNLLSGCLAMVCIFNYQISLVPYLTLASLVFDFFDGFAARYTKNSTLIGKELDSLADVVSFGLVPGTVIFQLLNQQFNAGQMSVTVLELYLLSMPGFIFTLFAALRLAKFNVDDRQTDGFIGLATPAATIFVMGVLEVFLHNSFNLSSFIFQPAFLYVMTLVLSLLMISEIPMFSFKFSSFGLKGNELPYLFIILSLILLATLKFAGIPLAVALYVLLSSINMFRSSVKRK